jgi:hypothetical protein
MKNIVFLKDLPSNLVEEAFVILKENIKLKNLECIEKNKEKFLKSEEKCTNEYILKEAELLVASYIEKIEANEKKEIPNNVINKKYKSLKWYSLISSVILFISLVINFI